MKKLKRNFSNWVLQLSAPLQRNININALFLCAFLFQLILCFDSINTYANKTNNARNKHHVASSKKMGKKSSISKSAILSVKKSKTTLQTLHEEIAKAKQQVSRLNAKEKSTINTLHQAQKKKVEISQKVGKLAGEVLKIQDTLSKIQKTESSLREKLQSTQNEYANLAKLYLNLSKEHEMGVEISSDLLPGTSTPSSGIMSRLPSYMQLLHKKLSAYLAEISKIQAALSYQQTQLSQHSSLQERIIKEKEKEQYKLQKTMNIQNITLGKVRSDKAMILMELDKKEKSARRIATMISTLIQEENKKQEKQSKSKTHTHNSDAQSTIITTSKPAHDAIVHSFEQQVKTPNASKSMSEAPALTLNSSGNFRWPSHARKILRSFGQYRNAVTNTIMDNPGLDIACSEGSSAFCTASGKVSLVHWLPGYNSMVIVDHGNSYRSVYANLAGSQVKKGQVIAAGCVIGQTMQSIDGEFLHFELWKGKHRLNPLSYCR